MLTRNRNNQDQGWSRLHQLLENPTQAKSSARMAEMSPCMFPVNNMTQLDAPLDHPLNKDWSHWEAEEVLAS